MPEVNTPVRSRELDLSPGLPRGSTLPGQRQDLHSGVVIIKDFSLRRLADQFVESGPNHFRRFRNDFPLCRDRQRNPQVLLQPFQTIKRYPAAVLQQPHHRRRRLVVFLLAHTLRRVGFKNVTAQVAAQTL